MTSTAIALSWSRLSDFLQCPRKFKYKYIDKKENFTVDDKSVHLVRGRNVHKALENYALKRIDGAERSTIPVSSMEEVEGTKGLIDSFIQQYSEVNAEQQICVDQNWNVTDWFSKTAYYRAIFDLSAVSASNVTIVDYKTGKFKDYSPDGPGQLELSAAVSLNMYPQIPVVNTMYAYVDHTKSIRRSYTQQDDRERLTVHFTKMHEIVNAEVNFDPVRNEFCGYCQATKAQCQFSKKI